MSPKSQTIKQLFSRIAASYDLNNAVLSFGIDDRWRKRAVIASQAKSGDSVLDCATGTGDLALAFKKVVGPEGRVLGTDFCPDMLEFAPRKALDQGFEIEWEVQDVLNLPYEDNTFDIASIAFGIRNVEDTVRGIAEMGRVVRPGGKVVVLEFGQPDGPIKKLYTLYSRQILPRIGGLISGDPEAYRYLNRSSEEYPCGQAFMEKMIEADVFSYAKWEKLTYGIAYLYVGTKR